MDRSNGITDLLDIAFISPNLAKHDIQFQIGDYLDSDHLTYPSKSQMMLHHIGIHLLTTSGINLIKPTKKYSNQHSRQL